MTEDIAVFVDWSAVVDAAELLQPSNADDM